jgi:uncharacterized protein GlcG (DUF336 family)
MRTVLVSSFALLAVLHGPAHAQGVTTEKNVSSALAIETAQAALARCTQQGYKVTVSVVDRSGQVIAMLRGDDARPHTMESSRRKAFTSFTMRNATAALAEGLKSNPGNAPLFTLPDLLPLAGGLPIKSGDEVIGGIGVGGAPGGNLDEACANAGIEKIKARL